MQCNAMQWQCNAMAMSCNAMQWQWQCNAMQCNAMQCNGNGNGNGNAMQCNGNAMQCNAMQCNAMQCNAMQCNAMQSMRTYGVAWRHAAPSGDADWIEIKSTEGGRSGRAQETTSAPPRGGGAHARARARREHAAVFTTARPCGGERPPYSRDRSGGCVREKRANKRAPGARAPLPVPGVWRPLPPTPDRREKRRGVTTTRTRQSSEHLSVASSCPPRDGYYPAVQGGRGSVCATPLLVASRCPPRDGYYPVVQGGRGSVFMCEHSQLNMKG